MAGAVDGAPLHAEQRFVELHGLHQVGDLERHAEQDRCGGPWGFLVGCAPVIILWGEGKGASGALDEPWPWRVAGPRPLVVGSWTEPRWTRQKIHCPWTTMRVFLSSFSPGNASGKSARKMGRP